MATEVKKIRKYKKSDNIAGYAFIGLFVIGFLVFTIIPVLSSLYYSFTNYNLIKEPTFTGLTNYIKMFTADKQFWVSMGCTTLYVIASVPLKLLFALVVAMLLKTTTKMTVFYRAAYYLPTIIGSSVAIAVVWRTMFSSDGLFNNIINSIFGTNITTSWIGGVDTAIWTLIVLAVWQYGSSMLIFLSGLKQIPTTFYEAAEIDGATKPAMFFKITLPMLTPVVFFNVVMQIIQGFMTFTQSYIITQGGPLDKTLFMTVYIYKSSFTYQKMGYGCAMAWVLLMMVAIITFFMFKSSDKWVFYESGNKLI